MSDKYHAYRLILEGLVIRSKFEEAEKKCLSTLSLIGCKFPRGDFLQTFALIKGVLKAKKLVAEKTDEDIRKLPESNDPEKQFGLLVMETLIAAAMGTGSKMTALPLLRQFEWIFKYGISSQSNVVFAGIGLVLTAIMGELKLGQKASRFDHIVYHRTQTKSTEARMLVCRYGLTLHMIEPFSDCLQRLLHGYRSGMEVGDLNYGLWSIQLYLMLAQCSGRRLDALNQDYSVYIRLMRDAEQQPATDFAIVHWQTIKNLIGCNGTIDNPTILTGDVMEQATTMANFVEFKKVIAVDLIHCRRVYLGCLFGKHQTAADLALELGEKFYQKSPGWPTFVETFFYGAISCLSSYQVARKRMYIRYARTQKKKVETWLREGSANFVHWKVLLDAELYALKRSAKVDKAKELYQKAILAAARTGRIHEHALARVRFGEYLLSINDEMGEEDDAIFQLREASRLFFEWGADALARALTEKHPRIQEIRCTSVNFGVPSSISLLD